VTICRKKASSTPIEALDRPVPPGRPSADCSSNPEKRGVRALVKSGNSTQRASDVPGLNTHNCS